MQGTSTLNGGVVWFAANNKSKVPFLVIEVVRFFVSFSLFNVCDIYNWSCLVIRQDDDVTTIVCSQTEARCIVGSVCFLASRLRNIHLGALFCKPFERFTFAID